MKVKAGSTVDDFVKAADRARKPIVLKLREIVQRAAPKAEESIKWGQPWWTEEGYLCYIAVIGDHVNFGFSRGSELTDNAGLLEGTGKGMRHIKLRSLDDIDEEVLSKMIRQAVKLNRLSAKERLTR